MIGCIRRKTGRLGQAGRNDRLYKKEDRQAGAGRQEIQADRNKEAGKEGMKHLCSQKNVNARECKSS